MNWPFNRRQSTETRLVPGGDAFIHPLDPPLTPRLASAEARDGVRHAITEMYEKGALDAGNGDVLDAWIDRLKPQWQAHLVMVSADREAAAQLAAGEYEAEAVAARERAQAAKAEQAETEDLLAVFQQQLVAPRQAEPVGRVERRRRPRPSVDSLEGLTHSWWWEIASKLLLLAAAGGDLASFYVTLAGMLTQSQAYMVWVLTIAVTAAAVGVMHVAGRTARNLREGQGGLGRIALTLMVLGWLVLGAAAFYVRTQVSPPGSSTTDAAFGADPTAATTGDNPLLSALLLGALFIGSGILAYWLGFSDHHPRMVTYRKLRKRLAKQRTVTASAEKAAAEADGKFATAKDEVRRTAQRAAAAQASIDAEIAELKELARIHVAGLIGDPAATNNLLSGRSGSDPTLPAPRLPRDEAGMAALNGVPVPSANGNGHHA